VWEDGEGGKTDQAGGRQGAVDVEQHDRVLDLALGEGRVGGHGCGGVVVVVVVLRSGKQSIVGWGMELESQVLGKFNK
jgi:hypothetical protein